MDFIVNYFQGTTASDLIDLAFSSLVIWLLFVALIAVVYAYAKITSFLGARKRN